MAFNLEKARQNGVPEEQIADYLASTRKYNLSGARADGVSDSDSINYLISRPANNPTDNIGETAPKLVEEPQSKLSSFLGGAGRAIISSEIGFGESIAGAIQPQTKATKELEKSRAGLDELQTRVLKRVKEKRAKGEDTSRLLGVLQDTGVLTDDFELNPALDKTTAQVIGEALGVAVDIVSFGQLPTSAKALVKVPQTFGQGVKFGAKTGAKFGAGFGGAKAFAGGLQKGEELGEAAVSGAKGAAVGAITGAVVGGVTGGISGGIKGKALKKRQFAEDLVSPKATDKVRVEAIEQGRLTDPTLLKKAGIEASKRDKVLADAVEDVVSPKADLGKNVDAIKLRLNQLNSGLKEFVANNKVPFNEAQLRSKLNSAKGDSKLIFASEARAEKVYDAVVDEFVKNVSKKDTAGLFQARQTVDKIPAIKKLLDSAAFGENVRREIVLDVRRAANEYVAELLPKGNKFIPTLLKESHMLEALNNMARKGSSTIGKNKLQLLAQEYPILKWIVGGAVGAAGVGVGGAILGSTD